jgi:hypothetical protein
MKVAAVVGLILALPVSILALIQVGDLQGTAEPLVTGPLGDLLGQSWLLFLLLAVAVSFGLIAAAVMVIRKL